MAEIFISYSRKDSEFARQLSNELQKSNRDVWIDWEDIPASAAWWDKICDGILASDNFVLIISPNSIASPICNLEISYGRELQKRFLPILYRDTNEAQAFAELFTKPLNDFQRALLQERDLLELARDNWKVLAGLNWIDFKDGAEFKAKLEDLLNAVDTDLDYVDDHTRLLVRAADWENRKRSPALLLRDEDLTEAERWLENAGDKSPQPTGLQRVFIGESFRIEDQLKRRTRRLQQASVIFGVLLIVALIASAFAGLTTMNALSTQATVEWQATYFALDQGRAATLAAGGVILPVTERTQASAAFIATATRIAALNVWQPIIREFNGVEMVQVPAGCFWMGSVLAQNEQPVHEVCFDDSFWLDLYEVTNEQFERLGGQAVQTSKTCDQNEDGTISSEERALCAQHPRDNISWEEARDFCDWRDGDLDDPQWQGVRLPTEAEWEYAARGPNSLLYPWGNEFVPEYVVYGRFTVYTAEVGETRRSEGQSWMGAYDMSGNVWEWVSTAYDGYDGLGEYPYPYNPDDGREEMEDSAVFRVLRGGGFLNREEVGGESDLRATYRSANFPDGFINVGFRCALSE